MRQQRETSAIKIINFVEERCNEWEAFQKDWVDDITYFENLMMKASKQSFVTMLKYGKAIAQGIIKRLGVLNTIVMMQLFGEQMKLYSDRYTDAQNVALAARSH